MSHSLEQLVVCRKLDGWTFGGKIGSLLLAGIHGEARVQPLRMPDLLSFISVHRNKFILL